MIFFLSVTFFIAYFFHIFTASGYLAPFDADIVIFVAAGLVLIGIMGHFLKRWQGCERMKGAYQEILQLDRRKEDPQVEMGDVGNVLKRDVKERREAEYGLRQSEDKHLSDFANFWRFDTTGEVVSMVAHELNQPLCAILNYSNVCKKLLRCNENERNKITDAIEEISVQATRAGLIIQSLRRLVANRELLLSKVNFNNDIVQEVIRIVKTEARQKDISIQTKLAEGLPAICIDKIQIIQVLLNLVRNAFDSMSNTKADRRRLIITTLLSKDNAIEISVRDIGEGMSNDIAGRVFDTFFTTKPEGLGIGLPLSRRIIEAHGGKIWAENNPDCGATYTFTLPIKEVSQYGKFQADSLYCR